MQYDSRHKGTVVNAHSLYSDLRQAFYKYIEDLQANEDVLKRFLTVWSSTAFVQPRLSSDWNKFKELVPSNLRFECERCGAIFPTENDSHF